MSSRRPVAPSRTFARRALTEFPGPNWPFAPQYTAIADVAARAFPESTDFYIGLGLDTYEFIHSWPQRNRLLVIATQLHHDGTVELIDYQSVQLPDTIN